MRQAKKTSLWKRLISIFIVSSTIPIILLCLFMLYNTADVLRRNTATLMQNSLKQLDDNMQVQFEAYEDVLYQMYTNDDVVEWVDKLNAQEDIPVTISQLRRYLGAILNSKEYIRSITIITESGMEVTYDQITATTYKNSWIGNFSMSMDALYEEISSDSKTHVYATEYGTNFANEDYYLFHFGHRIIDYRDLEKQNGIIILSLDEDMLRQILESPSGQEQMISANFLLDGNGRVISCMDKEKIGMVFHKETEKQMDAYKAFAGEMLQLNKDYISVYSYMDQNLQWEIVSVTDQSIYMKEIYHKFCVIALICVLLLGFTLFITWKLSGQLVESVNMVVDSMKKAGAGILQIRVPIAEKMPLEIEAIALQFNGTLEKLAYAQEKEKEANERRQQAEIRALEAQINPHFLYNTLDTINRMAIDRGEFDISNTINSLANILRYAITDINGIVCVRDEMEWLKKYIYLQQFRLKNKFIRKIEVSPEIMECKIHKLLLQPFVENAIIHGFKGEQEQYILEVRLTREGDYLQIVISDNGWGMEPSIVEKLNLGQPIKTAEKSHIGMDNAMMRLHMYCNGQEKVTVKSELGKGTEVTLLLPFKISN